MDAPVPTLSQARDALVRLYEADLSLDDRRALVSDVSTFFVKREGYYALQQELERMNGGLQKVDRLEGEMQEWRPVILRLLAAEAERIELEVAQRKEGWRLTTWLMSAVDAKTVLFLLAILGGLFGLSVTTSPSGIVVGAPPAEAPTTEAP